MKKLFLLLLLCAVQQLYAQKGNDLIKVTDMLRIKQVGGISISPDGNNVVFTVTIIEPDGDNKWEYKYLNQLFMVPVNGSTLPRQLTFKEGASQPAWSPDGKQLAFVRAVDGKPQVFLLSFDGGEPVQLTRFRYGAGTPKWSPDGKTDIILIQHLFKGLTER